MLWGWFFGRGFRNLDQRCADAKLARTIFQFPQKKLEAVAPGMPGNIQPTRLDPWGSPNPLSKALTWDEIPPASPI